MAKGSRPDLLPFAKLHRIGLPYHGLVRSGVLTLPDASTMAYPATHTGTLDTKRSICVRGQNYQATVDNTGQPPNFRWQNYALLSGSYREIGGQQLGLSSWLYSDKNCSWELRSNVTQSGQEITITVYLTGPFGVFGDGVPFVEDKVLSAYSFTPVHRETGAALTSGPAWSPRQYPGQYGTPMLFWMVPATTIFPYWFEAVKLTISGNGSRETGTVGNGISAAWERHLTAATAYAAGVYNAGVNAAGQIVETTHSSSETVSDPWYEEIEGVTYRYWQTTGNAAVTVGSIWSKTWSWDYTERCQEVNCGPTTELYSGSYPDDLTGLGAKPQNSDIISVEMDLQGSGVTHYLVHLTAGLLATMETDSYWTPACDPITGDYSMLQAAEFYV